MQGCVFCAIVTGDAPAAVVHETDELIAFLDARPISPGHSLVVPKRHAAGLGELDGATGERMFGLGHRLARAARAGALGADGVNLVLNDGRAAFQTVDHVHLHVIPRYAGDRRSLLRRIVRRKPRPSDDAASLLRGGLDAQAP
ncbi:Histidine triad (HIT) protein OS=Tsukamurella paurometabola (strain ATCC 8368 / DSM / CCUG 35730/ CIP 100753 / JCM 10117 / KCTC 9821 / NBRC 16120 / NCIMB 702349 / NCTC 13040) OX=521096 GN=Tpau_0711 PE=4 SV=1 [Tsukamurella paurometabola]|uniref:Histidine triad (HIT) protein n=1 Tax=Tsukamurella paurometabola (strain ATCC 8368 / DSM 20162 / CCUG 35730 / CIP 100753 / JCM 10117 / KCTC 9821 / NBRC 16120 / NCIMB 702349 / NCTC 13040) TaxID=521096 RepID=D5UT61_TSUPD|nr:HIT domain-containing protein [Tsukamurella paurometabola]ADG77348.1 histidine triad (HIT) protein [Tsukamurella paurometabola DSM 20162]SUP26580.1 purine nucleoside phosphoramidase [Tsukamurella paurometabola]